MGKIFHCSVSTCRILVCPVYLEYVSSSPHQSLPCLCLYQLGHTFFVCSAVFSVCKTFRLPSIQKCFICFHPQKNSSSCFICVLANVSLAYWFALLMWGYLIGTLPWICLQNLTVTVADFLMIFCFQSQFYCVSSGIDVFVFRINYTVLVLGFVVNLSHNKHHLFAFT